MLVDLAINPFGADVDEMTEIAIHADQTAIDRVWVADHFSGVVAGRPWSRDPFVCLGAFAAATDRVGLGVLVANMANRHPAQLASAVNSVQSLAPGRVRLGLGSGAAPGSRFAAEHVAIGRDLGDAARRRVALADYVAALRGIWAGESSFDGGSASYADLTAVVDDHPIPQIVIGASAWPTIELALEIADGVNVRRSADLPALLGRVRDHRARAVEISVLDTADALDVEIAATLRDHGVDRLIAGLSAPFDRTIVDGLAVLASI